MFPSVGLWIELCLRSFFTIHQVAAPPPEPRQLPPVTPSAPMPLPSVTRSSQPAQRQPSNSEQFSVMARAITKQVRHANPYGHTCNGTPGSEFCRPDETAECGCNFGCKRKCDPSHAAALRRGMGNCETRAREAYDRGP